MKTIYEIKTGKALSVEAVDAKEILKQSPELYTDVAPGAKGEGEGKPSDGLKVDELKAALAAKNIEIPDGVTLKADLAALLDAAP